MNTYVWNLDQEMEVYGATCGWTVKMIGLAIYMEADTIFRSYQQSLVLFQIQLFEPLTFLNGYSTGNQMFKNRKRIAGNVIYTNLLIYPHGPVHRGYPPWHVSYTFSRLVARIEVYSHTSRKMHVTGIPIAHSLRSQV